jgi:hypothetical protein
MRITRIPAFDENGGVQMLWRTVSAFSELDDRPDIPVLHRLDSGERLTPADGEGRRLQTLDGRVVVTLAG